MAQFLVDVLDPTTFAKAGVVKTIQDAWRNGDWIASSNLWVFQQIDGVNFILYQQRANEAAWAPGLLDVTVGGHYEAGESVRDGLREVREEIGKNYDFDTLKYLGKKLYLRDEGERKLRYVVDVLVTIDNADLGTFILERNEIAGLYRCSLDDLIKVHTVDAFSFISTGIRLEHGRQSQASLSVTRDSFPYNWDNYHYKMALIGKRFLANKAEPILY